MQTAGVKIILSSKCHTQSFCSYLSGCPFQDLEIVTYPFASWLIDFSVDTTTTPTYCAYDRSVNSQFNFRLACFPSLLRIIAVDDTRDHVVPDSAQVYRFDTDLSLSPEQVSLGCIFIIVAPVDILALRWKLLVITTQ